MKTLILYHSQYGQTARIVQRIQNVLLSLQTDVRLMHVDELNAELLVGDFDSFIIACPIYRSQHSAAVGKFIRQHLTYLRQAKTLFISVSMAAAGNAAQRAEAESCMEQFLHRLGWQPDRTAIVAGALNYLDYNWFVRWIMKRITAKAGGETDTSRNHEYTDWELVESLAHEFAVQLRANTPNTEVVDGLTGTSMSG